MNILELSESEGREYKAFLTSPLANEWRSR